MLTGSFSVSVLLLKQIEVVLMGPYAYSLMRVGFKGTRPTIPSLCLSVLLSCLMIFSLLLHCIFSP